jgi:hypothetical protein
MEKTNESNAQVFQATGLWPSLLTVKNMIQRAYLQAGAFQVLDAHRLEIPDIGIIHYAQGRISNYIGLKIERKKNNYALTLFFEEEVQEDEFTLPDGGDETYMKEHDPSLQSKKQKKLAFLKRLLLKKEPGTPAYQQVQAEIIQYEYYLNQAHREFIRRYRKKLLS